MISFFFHFDLYCTGDMIQFERSNVYPKWVATKRQPGTPRKTNMSLKNDGWKNAFPQKGPCLGNMFVFSVG